MRQGGRAFHPSFLGGSCRERLAYAATFARGANVRLRVPWNLPSGSPAGAPAPDTRALATPAAEAFAPPARLPVSLTLSDSLIASPPVGLKVTLSV